MKYTKLINWFKCSTLGHRLVYMAGNSGHESAESPENPSEIKVTKIEDLNGREADFDANNRDKTLSDLANNDPAMKNNLALSIKETLRNASYKDKDGKDAFTRFWETMGEKGCSKVQIKDGKIQFLDNRERLMNPRKSNISIVFDISKLETTQPRTAKLTEEPITINGKTVKQKETSDTNNTDKQSPIAQRQALRTEIDSLPLDLHTFGSAKMSKLSENNINDLKDVAKLILTKSAQDLQTLGFVIGDENLLKEVKDSKISVEQYAEILKSAKRGDTINLVFKTRDNTSRKLEETLTGTGERRRIESFKLSAREEQIYQNNF